MARGQFPAVKTLQALLSRIGSTTGGSKEVMLRRLQQDIQRPEVLPMNDTGKSTRILSIDMGIKNLALCVADVKLRKASSGTAKKDGTVSAELKVVAWRRLDVVKELSTPDSEAQSVAGEKVDDGDVYTPSALARTANALVMKTLLPYKPDVILIERQRWRSGGGAAVQQWTVRVNTLEGMLWALLTAFRSADVRRNAEDGSHMHMDRKYDIFEVDPKRVGSFWLGEGPQKTVEMIRESARDGAVSGSEQEIEKSSDSKKSAGGKIEKKAKIMLLKSWLSAGALDSTAITASTTLDGAPIARTPNMDLNFSEEAEATRNALCATSAVGRSKGKRTESAQALKKLDDVTDCFLQAAAFVAWEHNRSKVKKEWKDYEKETSGRY